MLGISGEHLLVLFVILLIFGPRRLPELGNSLGRTLRNFKSAMAGKDAEQAAAKSAAASAPIAQASLTAENPSTTEAESQATIPASTKS